MYQFILPDIGEGVVEAEVLTWHVAVGDFVAENQVMVELMTDKATVEIPSPKEGFVKKLCYQQGDIVEVGQVLIEIDDSQPTEEEMGMSSQANEDTTEKDEGKAEKCDDTISIVEAEPPEITVEDKQSESVEESEEELPHNIVETCAATSVASKLDNHPPSMPARPHSNAPKPFQDQPGGPSAVPAVRDFAKQNNVDLHQVQGTGPLGRIMKRDIQNYLDQQVNKPAHVQEDNSNIPAVKSAPTEDPEDWTRKPLRGLRRAIANRMSHSIHTAAHYTYVEELDATDLMRLKNRLKDDGINLSPLAFVTQACIRCIPDHPAINSAMDDDRGEVIYKDNIHIGVATATQDGLVVPVIHNCESLSLSELSSNIADLADRARHRKLKPEELKGGTFTVSSLGKLGGIMATPVINYPQAAILGVHRLQTLPRYINNALQPRQIMNISISLDHRIIDGYEAALFIEQVKGILESADFQEPF